MGGSAGGENMRSCRNFLTRINRRDVPLLAASVRALLWDERGRLLTLLVRAPLGESFGDSWRALAGITQNTTTWVGTDFGPPYPGISQLALRTLGYPSSPHWYIFGLFVLQQTTS